MTGTAINQNAILKFFKIGETLTLTDLVEGTGVTRIETIKAAGKLVSRGLIRRQENALFALSKEGKQAKVDGLVIKSGPMGPDSAKSRKPFKNTIRQRAWTTMRIMTVFSTNDLVAIASDQPTRKDHTNVQRYCRALQQAGYLLLMPTREKGAAETSNGFMRYRLDNDTGEIAPTYRNTKSEVFDHNSREVFPCLT